MGATMWIVSKDACISCIFAYLLLYISNAVPMMTVYFEDHFHTPLDELRRQLNVTPAPVPLNHRTMP